MIDITAEYTVEGGWEFFEQDSFELMWFPGTATPERIAKAAMLIKQRCVSRFCLLDEKKTEDKKTFVGGNVEVVWDDEDTLPRLRSLNSVPVVTKQ